MIMKRLNFGLFKSRIAWIVKIVFTVLFFLFVNRSLNREQCRLVINNMDFNFLIPVCFFWVLSFFFQVKRWELILRQGRFRTEKNTAWRTFLFGSFLAFITPGRAGELFRGINIQEDKKGSSVVAVLVDKFFHTGTIVLTGAVLAFTGKFVFGKRIDTVFLIMLVAAFSVLILFLFMFFIFRKTKLNRSNPAKIFRRIICFIPEKGLSGVYVITVLSLLSHICLMLQTVFLFIMFGYNDFFRALFASGQAYAFISFFPFFIGNMGIREYSFNIFFLRYSDSVSAVDFIGSIALTVSTAVLILNYIIPACAGLFLYYFGSKEVTKVFQTGK